MNAKLEQSPSEMLAEVQVNFECPCGGRAGVGALQNGEPFVIHTVPFCESFGKRDPTEFLRWVRHQFQKASS